MKQLTAEIGIFGSPGFFKLAEDFDEYDLTTEYGKPSEKIAIGEIGGRRVAFLYRHGYGNKTPSHMINYLANVKVMAQIGVSQIISPSPCRSLRLEIKPGDFVICDQLVNLAGRRRDTFYDGPVTTHISMLEPYCPTGRKIAVSATRELNIPVHEKATAIIVEGPRFNTYAEYRWFQSIGGDVINMTQYPECVLAREQEICYTNISLVTAYDLGLLKDLQMDNILSLKEIQKTLTECNEKLHNLFLKLLPILPERQERTCICSHALLEARFG